MLFNPNSPDTVVSDDLTRVTALISTDRVDALLYIGNSVSSLTLSKHNLHPLINHFISLEPGYEMLWMPPSQYPTSVSLPRCGSILVMTRYAYRVILV